MATFFCWVFLAIILGAWLVAIFFEVYAAASSVWRRHEFENDEWDRFPDTPEKKSASPE